jgi:ABC-2 type transport system ATP-binding protein
VLVSTAYMDEAERCDRVGLLDHGRFIALDAPTALQARMHGQVVAVRSPDARRVVELLRPLPFVRRATLFGDTVHVVVTEDGASRGRIAQALRDANLPASEVEEVEASLEDVFIERVSGAPVGGGEA